MLLALVESNSFSRVRAHWPTGTDACPCIDPWAQGQLELSPEHAPRDRRQCNITRSDGVCFPASYGSTGCAAYDDAFTPECVRMGSLRPKWCQALWCWVDPENCQRSHMKSNFFPGVKFKAQSACHQDGLSLSYETCGYVNRFSTSEALAFADMRAFAAKSLGGKLRIGFPSDSGTGYTLVSHGQLFPDSGLPKVPAGGGVRGTNYSGSSRCS